MNFEIRPYIHLTICVLSLFLTLPAGFNSPLWGASPEDERTALIEGAKKEGKVVWYTTMGVPEHSIFARSFEAKYPSIKVETLRLDGPKLMHTLLAEAGANVFKADAINIPGVYFQAMKQRGIFLKYMPMESLSYLEGAKDPDGYGCGLFLSVKTVAYNKKLVSPKDVPRSYADLLDPKWKGGKLSVDTNQYEWFGNMLRILGREKGIELMKKISMQRPQVRTGSTLRITLLAAGEFAIAVPANGDRMEMMKAMNAPIEWVGAEPVIATKEMAPVAAKAPHPNAAKLFTEFVLSREGQEIMRNVGKIPARADVEPKAARLTKGYKLYYADLILGDTYGETTRDYDDIFIRRRWKDERW